MGNFGWSGIIIVAVLIVLLFGRGKISDLMGDVAKGIKSFKKGMKDPTQDSKDPIQDSTESVSSKDKSSEDPNSDKK